MNPLITYGSIFILTLILIVALINVPILSKVFKGQKGAKIIIVTVIIMSYCTLVIYPVNKILNKQILSKKLIQGDKGPRGNRGEPGNNAQCNTCGDELCLKKILFNITNTYNYWRSLNGLDLYPDTYTIKNEFLKDKIRKHCKSDEFKKIIKKYGSNNRDSCPDELSSCGIYDYLFKMWSIWILIILKYKNGYLFLESDSLTDKDFDGLIEKEDSFQLADYVKYNDSQVNYKVDKTKDLYPFFIISNVSNNRKTNAHINEIRLLDEQVTHNGSIVWNPETYSYNNMFKKNETDYNLQTHGLNVKIIKKIKDDDGKVIFDAEDYNDDFFKVNGTPSRGKLSPFDEIEKYKSWYWGRSKLLKPKIVVKNPDETDKSFFKKTCYNDKKIKILETNNFFELFSTKNISQNIIGNERIQPFNKFGSANVKFFRPRKYIDKKEHHFFRTYKPVGDIIVSEAELLLSTDSRSKNQCLPVTDDHKSEFFRKYATNNVKTILVSGDTKAPIDYEVIYTSVKTRGINKYLDGFTIWKPIPPPNYKSLGYVIDTRSYPPSENPPKPSFNIVVCVPEDVTIQLSSGLQNIWSTESKNIDNIEMRPANPIILYRNPVIYTFKVQNDEHSIIDRTNQVCKTYDEVLNEQGKEDPIFNMPSFPKRTQIKDKKYSILRLYD